MIYVVAEFEVDLTRGLGDSDAYVHRWRLPGTASCLLRRDDYIVAETARSGTTAITGRLCILTSIRSSFTKTRVIYSNGVD